MKIKFNVGDRVLLTSPFGDEKTVTVTNIEVIGSCVMYWTDKGSWFGNHSASKRLSRIIKTNE